MSTIDYTNDVFKIDVQMLLPNGPSFAPSMSFGNDPDTGIYSDTEDRIGFTTGGSHVMVIDDNQAVAIGATVADSTSILELSTTTKGFLPPRLTTTQRDAITTPAEGLLIYNTTTNALNLYTTSWGEVGGGGSGEAAFTAESAPNTTPTATGTDAIAIADGATASGANSLALGKSANAKESLGIAIGKDAITGRSAGGTTYPHGVAIGYGAESTHDRAIALGYQSNTTYGSSFSLLMHDSVTISTQKIQVQMTEITTDATQTLLTGAGESAGFPIASGLVYMFSGRVIASASGIDMAAYTITDGVIENDAGTTTMKNSPTVTVLVEDVAGWDVTVNANDTADTLEVLVTGASATIVQWFCELDILVV